MNSDDSQEKNDLFSDSLFKNVLCKYINLLVKGDPVKQTEIVKNKIKKPDYYNIRTTKTV